MLVSTQGQGYESSWAPFHLNIIICGSWKLSLGSVIFLKSFTGWFHNSLRMSELEATCSSGTVILILFLKEYYALSNI